ncbi:MAG: SdiA-regulated domain-containing protein [Arcicella sp.]|nr:SdiA-regulated domain-containing protein [Arcicella sp.]
MKKNLILFLSLLLVYGCEPKKKTNENNAEKISETPLAYDFENPSEKYVLPKKLKEISGLSYFKKNQLICINDEDGKIFIYDLVQKDIVEKISFGKDGDYEGVEFVDDEVFVLKSNGRLKGFKIGLPFEREIDCTNPDVIEYEGLGYDPNTKHLLLAAKERVKDKDDKKMIYAYDFEKKVLFKNIGIPEEQVTDKANGKEFKPSGIAVHPQTGQIFIIASAGKKLLILAKDGHKEALISLNPKTFIQPEGICFSPEGELFISSEGKDSEGYILKFTAKK